MNVKKIGMEAAIVGALAATSLGIGSAVANADQAVPNSSGLTWKLDRPHHNDWDDWDDWDDDEWRGWRGGPGWDGPGYYYGGPCAWVPPAVSGWVPPAAC